jgi:hypothetical protein
MNMDLFTTVRSGHHGQFLRRDVQRRRGAGQNEGDGLQRLRGGTHRGDQLRIAGERDELSVAGRHRHRAAVPRLDDPAAAHFNEHVPGHALSVAPVPGAVLTN